MKNHYPLMISSPKPLVLEHDCACPAQGSSWINPAQTINIETIALINNRIYRRKIDSRNELFFDVENPTGVNVLNREAVKLLESFSTATSYLNVHGKNIGPLEANLVFEFMKSRLILPVEQMEKDSPPTIKKTSEEILEVWLHVTNECNLRCDYCYLRKDHEFMRPEVLTNSLDAIYRSAIKHDFKYIKIKYAGGEPLLNMSGLRIAHQYANELSLKTGIVLQEVVLTNGTTITKEKVKFFLENNIRIMVSLDGLGEDNDVQRHYVNQNGSFKLVEKGLLLLSEMGCHPIVSITITDKNCKGLAKLVKWLLINKLHFTFNFYRENDLSAHHKLAYNDKGIISALDEAFDVIEQYPPDYNILGMLSDRARLDAFHTHTCGVGNSYMVISHKGEIAKCQMHMDAAVGTIDSKDPLDLIRNDQFGIQNLPVAQKQGCNSCSWQNVCAGGCPALTYRVTGRFDVKSPNCNIYKEIFPRILVLEAKRLLYVNQQSCNDIENYLVPQSLEEFQ